MIKRHITYLLVKVYFLRYRRSNIFEIADSAFSIKTCLHSREPGSEVVCTGEFSVLKDLYETFAGTN